MSLIIKNLHVSIDGTPILKGVNLELKPHTIHILMGPNGTGKSSLAHALMGHPKYTITQGNITLNGEDITHATPTERARKGLFLSFQYPREISGVSLANFLRTAYNATHTPQLSVLDFHALLKEHMNSLDIDPSFAKRSLNEGFSGGEKKKTEILQMKLLNPAYAILDECDSGLDVSALKIVGQGVQKMKNPQRGILIITHYTRLLHYLAPDTVSIMIDGKIVQQGGKELAHTIEEHGYKKYTREVAHAH